MKFGRFRLGLRTIKTAVTIAIIAVFMHLTGRGEGATMIAAVTALVAVRDSFSGTVEAGRARLIGQSVGGIFSIVYFMIYQASGYQFFVQVLVISLLTMLIIIILDGFGLHAGLVGGTATFLMVTLSIPVGSALSYSLNRVIDSFIGVVIAILVNSFWIHDAPYKGKKSKPNPSSKPEEAE